MTTITAKPISDRELIRISKDFTLGLLGGRETRDMCYIVSSALEGYLNSIGVKCEAVEGLFDGWHHWWIELEYGRVIDGTSDQFKGHRNYWAEQSSLHKEE